MKFVFDIFKTTIDKTIESKRAIANKLDKVKRTEKISQFSQYYKQNEKDITKVVGFGRATMNHVNHLMTLEKEKKTVFSYVNCALDIKNNFVSNFEKDKEKEKAIKEPRWIEQFSDNLVVLNKNWFVTKELFDKKYPEYITYEPYNWYKNVSEDYPHLKYDEDKPEIIHHTRSRVFVKDDIVIYWDYENVYVDKKCQDSAYELMREVMWDYYDNQAEHTIINNSYVFQSLESEKLIVSKKAQQISDDLGKFLNKGYSRSILFYGPPGTGKSNTVKNVAKNLGKTFLRLKINFAMNDWSTVQNWLKIMRPEIVMIEDIDHDGVSGSNVLTGLETITKYCKLLLATANQVSRLNDAVVRPERFDQLIEIDRMEEEVLLGIVGGDREIFEMVRGFPIVSTLEFMKRVDVMGKEYAMANSEDIKIRLQNSSKRYNCKLEV